MNTAATVRITSAEEITAAGGGETEFLRLPLRDVFAQRSGRFAALAKGHALQDYLRFLSELAQAQHDALQSFPSVPLPDTAALRHASLRGVSPLAALDWPRDFAWHQTARGLAQTLGATALVGNRSVLERVAAADDEWLEQQADCLLNGVTLGLDMAASAFVAAALQVYWVHMVGAVQAAHPGVETFGRTADATTCPCCGSAPVASITHGSGTSLGQRYLVCSLCSAQWHMVRIQCSHCESTEGIAYQSLDLADGNVVASAYDERGAHTNARHAAQAAILAETCDTCGRYLKILHTDRDPALDPVADDVASLTLDLLVAQSGKHRHGVNLMLLFGEGEPEPDTPKPGVA